MAPPKPESVSLTPATLTPPHADQESDACKQQLEPVPSRVALNGHLGHLTEAQDKALQEFKARLEQNGYYTPARVGTALPSADDVTLV